MSLIHGLGSQCTEDLRCVYWHGTMSLIHGLGSQCTEDLRCVYWHRTIRPNTQWLDPIIIHEPTAIWTCLQELLWGNLTPKSWFYHSCVELGSFDNIVQWLLSRAINLCEFHEKLNAHEMNWPRMSVYITCSKKLKSSGQHFWRFSSRNIIPYLVDVGVTRVNTVVQWLRQSLIAIRCYSESSDTSCIY